MFVHVGVDISVTCAFDAWQWLRRPKQTDPKISTLIFRLSLDVMNPWIDIDTRWEPHIAIRPKLMKVAHKVYEDYDPTCPPSDRSPSLAYQLEPEDLLEPCVVIVNLHDPQQEGVHFMINLNNNHIRDKYKEESFHAPSELSSVFSELRQYIRGLLRYNQERKEAAERRQREDEEKRHEAKLKKLKEQMAKEKVFLKFSRMVLQTS